MLQQTAEDPPISHAGQEEEEAKVHGTKAQGGLG
jgi:hypothetical protein